MPDAFSVNYKLIAVSGTGVVNTIGITTDVATFGPFCNSQDNTFNVNFSKTGTFTATDFSVQLSELKNSEKNEQVLNLLSKI